MLGAIAGDIIGSVYEFGRRRQADFPLFSDASKFTDDTVLTVAVADCLLHDQGYVDTFHRYAAAYPWAGYGMRFMEWALSKHREPYGSWGNGSAMRVSAVAYRFDFVEEVLAEAERSARVTHDHPEGIRGAQAIAAAIFLARQGESKARILSEVEERFGYGLRRSLAEISAEETMDESCQSTVPAALVAFLDSSDYEDCVRKAVALGGDTDTLACIAGSVAEAHYGGVPEAIARAVLDRLDAPLRSVTQEFRSRYVKLSERSL